MVANGYEPELSLRLGGTLSCPVYAERREEDEAQQQITVFYGGRICVWDVTDIQAKAIICTAKLAAVEKGMKEEEKQQQYEQKLKELSPCQSPPSSRLMGSQLIGPELSMKRSLQHFLQKRKARINAASPYNSIHRH